MDTSFSIDTGDLRAMIRRMRADVGPESTERIRMGLRAAAEVVAAEAKLRSAWSTRIPGSIRTSSLVASAKVTAGGPRAPEAAPLNNEGRSGSFRHPVFATGDRSTWTWVDQTARPFLEPALEATRERAVGLIADSIEDGLLEVFG